MKGYIALLLTILLLVSAALELGTRRTLPRTSQVSQRLNSEQASAVRIRRAAGEPAPVLIVGNSLLGSGVIPQTLDNQLRPEYRAVRFVVEDTNYFDWYYGLRRLFREGARPNTVVLMMNARQLSSNGVRGDIFARVLMDPQDALRIQNDVGTDNTITSGYVFATLSDFYGFRSEIRKKILVSLLPDFPNLTARLRPANTPIPSDEELLARIQPRLARMVQLCREYGAELVLVLPPGNDEKDGSAAVQIAAQKADIPVLVPFGPRQLPPALYSDGIHLNPEGAAIFTRALGDELRMALEEQGRAGLRDGRDSSVLAARTK